MYYSDKFTFTTGVTTGIETEDFLDIIVFPNPAIEYLNIKSTNPIEKIEFLDLNGRILFVKTTENLLNISNCPTGLYFIKVFTDKGIAIRRIVKK